MKKLSTYLIFGLFGVLLSVSFSSCSPSSEDGTITLRSAPTDKELRSGKLAFTFLAGNASTVSRVIIPGYLATSQTALSRDQNNFALGIPLTGQGNGPRSTMQFIWYTGQFTYIGPRAPSEERPEDAYTAWFQMDTMTTVTGADPNEVAPAVGMYYLYFSSIFTRGNFALNANDMDNTSKSGVFELSSPWVTTVSLQ